MTSNQKISFSINPIFLNVLRFVVVALVSLLIYEHWKIYTHDKLWQGFSPFINTVEIFLLGWLVWISLHIALSRYSIPVGFLKIAQIFLAMLALAASFFINEESSIFFRLLVFFSALVSLFQLSRWSVETISGVKFFHHVHMLIPLALLELIFSYVHWAGLWRPEISRVTLILVHSFFLGAIVVKTKKSKIITLSRRLSVALLESSLLYFLFAVLVATISAGSLYPTYADAVSTWIPLARDLQITPDFPDHLYNYSRLMAAGVPLLASIFMPTLGIEASAWMVAWFFSVILLAIYECSRVVFDADKASSMMAALIFASIPAVWVFSTVLYLDIPQTAACICAVNCALYYQVKRSPVALILLSVCVGFSFVTKYNAILITALILPLLFVFGEKKFFEFEKKQFKTQCLMGVVVFLFAAPWFYRSFNATGNPVFPIMNSIWAVDVKGGLFAKHIMEMFPAMAGFNNWMAMPWMLVVQTSKFGEYLNGMIGVLLLPLGFVGIICAILLPRRRLVVILLFSSFAYLLLSQVIAKIAYFRYWFIAIVLILPLIARGISPLLQGAWFIRFFMGLLASLQMVYFFAAGVRVNYFVPHGVGLFLWLDHQQLRSWEDGMSSEVIRKLNAMTTPLDRIITTGVHSVVSLRPRSIMINNDTYWVMRDLDKVSFPTIVEKNQVSYWLRVRDSSKICEKITAECAYMESRATHIMSDEHYTLFRLLDFDLKTERVGP